MKSLRHILLSVRSTRLEAIGCIACCLMLAPLAAQTRSELEKKQQETRQEMEETEKLLQQTLQKKSASVQAISLLNSKISQRNSIIESIRGTIKTIDGEIRTTENEIAFTRKNIEAIKKKYAALIEQAYKYRTQHTDVLYILSASNLNEAYTRTKYFREIADYRKKQIDELAAEQASLTRSLEKLQTQRNERQALLASEQSEQQKLQTEKKQQNDISKQLNLKESQLKKDIAAKKKSLDQLDKTIRDLIAKEAEKQRQAAQKAGGAAPQETIKLSASFKENKAKLPWPCNNGVITGKFGTYAHPVYPSVTLDNSGIDITAKAGTAVQSVFEGTVLYLALVPGSNMAVVIQHGNYISLYQNLVNVMVKKGDHVQTGQQIGEIYTDPQSQTATLHLEIWEQQTKLNPALWLRPKR